MTVTLTIKNVPDNLIKLLRARALRNHRSLRSEILSILEETLIRRRISVDEVYRRVREIGLTTPPESAAIARTERDTR